jgi:putative membrane protein
MTSLATLPAFLGHFALAILLLAGGVWLHTRLTPIDEWALVRQGNTGAAIALAGVVLGFALPVGSAISHSAGILDALVWGVVALAAQQGAFLVCTRWLLPDWRAAMIERGEVAGAVLKGAAAAAVGMLNAACLVV